MKKTAILKTPFTIITSRTERNIDIVGSSFWNLTAEFIKQDERNLFEELGFHGVLL